MPAPLSMYCPHRHVLGNDCWAPIAAHFTINLLNLRFIVRTDLDQPVDRTDLTTHSERIAAYDLQPRKR